MKKLSGKQVMNRLIMEPKLKVERKIEEHSLEYAVARLIMLKKLGMLTHEQFKDSFLDEIRSFVGAPEKKSRLYKIAKNLNDK